MSTEDRELVAFTKSGYALRVPMDKISAKGDRAKANNFIRLSDGDELIYAGIHKPDDVITWWTGRETVGSTRIGDIPGANIGTKGKKFTSSRQPIVGAVRGMKIGYRDSEDTDHEYESSRVLDTDAGDRNLARSVAKGIAKANLVWAVADFD